MATQPISNLVTTWNAAGTTFTAVKMNVTDTASAAGSLLIDLQVGGSSRFNVRKDGVVQTLNVYATGSLGYALFNDNGLSLNSSARIGFTATGSAQNAQDLQLHRDAANTLAQRNSTNAQAFRVYNTYTDASNYERLDIRWVSNSVRLETQKAGTGTARNLILGTDASARWVINGTTGHFLAGADNTYDIGESGANRPRNAYVAGSYFAAANVAVGGSVLIGGGSGNLVLKGQSSGVGTLQDTNQTDFNRLQFGGTTSSFPALKRNGTAIETKLADDSAYAPHAMQFLDVTDGITAPASATGRARIYVDTADGDLKVIFADGTIKTIVTDT